MPARLSHRIGDTILGRFEVQEVLGSGSYGTVYRCREQTTGEQVAIKEMHLFNDPLAVAQGLDFFRREAATLTSLRHDAIPRARPETARGPFAIDPVTGQAVDSAVADAVEVDERHYLVMEIVDGTSLENRVRRAQENDIPLAADAVLAWCRQIAEALAYLHDRGLVHRDVKPQNILVRNSDRRAMLIDFGLTREVREVPGYGTVPMSESGRFGTPGYAPPDPVEQEDPVPASDQHALGMTVRRALTFLAPTVDADLARLRAKRMLELRPDLEPHVAAALDRTIRPDARDRFPSMAAFIEALEAPPAPLAAAARTQYVELQPTEIDAGPLAPGQLKDLTLVVRDRRSGQSPQGYAVSPDERLRILPATRQGDDIVLHLLLRVPRNAVPGPVRTRLTVTANNEEYVVPIAYVVDPEARPDSWMGRMGCALLPVQIVLGR